MHCMKGVYREDKVRVLGGDLAVTLGDWELYVPSNEGGLIAYRNLINVRILNILTREYSL